ncbi:MAG: relaxase/mobilization nuclease domain-containing protein [Clostridia bacterium]|nr:relaxase/mobilization nuclease domain-containing protein [Clostridia bacterium]
MQNLFDDEDYAEQFKQTAARFGKGGDKDERKYYHFKLSPARDEHANPYMVQEYAKACAEEMFPDCECVIATHTDTDTVHAHIIVNAVNPITGKKLHISGGDYAKLKDMANDIGVEFGYTPLDFRKKADINRTTAERQIILKGGTSWKEDLREVIEEAKQTATTETEFIEHLKLYEVEIKRNGQDYSYLHPQRQKAVRGTTLGQDYTKTEVLNVITKHKDGRNGNAARSITEEQRDICGKDGERPAERSVSFIEREMQRLNRTAELARAGIDPGSEQPEKREQQVGKATATADGQSNRRTQEYSTGREELQGGDKPKPKRRFSDFSK